jgi:uncharacterized protein
VVEDHGGAVIFNGKITEVATDDAVDGFTRGYIIIQSLEATSAGAERLCVDFQNENIVARKVLSSDADPKHPSGEVCASVPDIITLVASESARPYQTEELRYGLRVDVLVLPAHPLHCTPAALKVVGPAAFHFPDVPYTPIGEYREVEAKVGPPE